MFIDLKLQKAFVLAAVAAGGLALSKPAMALPVFTLAPSALGGGAAGVANFTADDLTLSDYSTITFTPTGSNTSSFTESGTLAVVQAQLANSNVATPLGTQYGVYFSFNATGNQTNFTPTLSSGTFDTLSFSLYGYAIGPSSGVTYNPNSNTPTGVVDPTLLATGSLQDGTVTLTNGIPSANANVNFTVVDPAFFVAPVPFYDMAFSAFTNTQSEVNTVGNVITINSGGGTANFGNTPVPEPLSLALLGTGLAVVGLTRLRSKAS